MSKTVLIATHAHLASGFLSALKLLTGIDDKIQIIDAYVDGNDRIESQISDFIKQTNNVDSVIFTDLLGGSVNQKVINEVADRKNITIITQTNLAVLMSVVLTTKPLTHSNLQNLIKETQVRIVESVATNNSVDDDF